MKESVLNRLATAIALLLFLLAYGPLVWLSAHNHPSAADDYCFADTSVRYGFWQAQKYYYDGWTGRYFSNMLVHANPLVWNWYNGFRFIPALAITALLAACYALIDTLFADRSHRLRALVTGLLFFTLIVAMQGTVEAFFWTAAVASYTVPTILTIYLLAVLLRWYRLPAGGFRNLTSLWAGVLVFAIVGSSETNLVLLLIILGAAFGSQLLFRGRFDALLAGLLVVGLVSAWLVFRAPGNAIRMGANTDEGNILVALKTTVQTLGLAGLSWLWRSPLLPLSVFWLPLARILTRPGSQTAGLFRLPALLLGAGVLLTILLLVFPSVYGLGSAPVRVMNLAWVVFVFGWFYTLTTATGRWQAGSDTASGTHLPTQTPAWLTGLAAVWLVGSAPLSPTLRQLFYDLRSGHAAQYDRDMTLRHTQLMQPADTLRLAPISVYPPSLFLEDIKADQQHWWNRCQSGYYGHKAIILDTLANPRPEPVDAVSVATSPQARLTVHPNP